MIHQSFALPRKGCATAAMASISTLMFIVSTWLSKIAQWIIVHHPTVVSQKVLHLIWLVQKLHLLLQSHVLIWIGEIP